MTLAIRIGASTQTYDNLATANSMRGNQKLAITGTGAEIKNSLADMVANSNLIANGIGSIKATDDIVLLASEVTTYKAALVKLGTRSIVLDSGTVNTDVATNFNELDAVYTKIKSLRLAAAPTIAVEKLATAVNFAGLESLSGQVFNVSGSAATIKANMTSLLKNISKVGTITIASGSTVELTASQLSTLGDKLRKTDSTSVVVLKDTADNILTTGNLALINRLNNSNINTASNTIAIASGNGAATDTTGVITVASSLLTPFTTGDAVTFTGATVAAGATNGSTALTQGDTAFIRKLSATTFAIYDTYAHAVDTASRAGIRNTTNTMTGNLVSEGGNAPVRVNTLNKVEVTKATLAQTNRFGELTAIIGATAQGVANRLLSNIVSSVSITDTATNLMDTAGNVTKTVTAIQTMGAASATVGAITSTGHGFNTGDAVTYNMTLAGGTAYNGLTSGSTYYVGKIGASADQFVLFDTRAKALAANLTTQATAYANATGTGSYIDVNATGTAASAVGNHTFTASTLDKAISKVGKFMDNTGTVARVTIAGSGSISATTIDDIATKALRGNSAAQVTYSAKAVDVQNNLQALYDNQNTSAAKKLTEIVVTDGTSTGKKQIQMTQAFYTVLNPQFTRGVDQGGSAVNKNYSYNITNAAFDAANPTALQADVNVASYSITGATVTNLTTDPQLRIALGQSKLKTLTTVSGISSTDRSTITTILNSIGSGTDRAKLKMIA